MEYGRDMATTSDNGSIHDWLQLAGFFLRSARAGMPGSLLSIHQCHVTLLKQISQLSDIEAERLEPMLTSLEQGIMAFDRES
jgi:hypothetical protein